MGLPLLSAKARRKRKKKKAVACKPAPKRKATAKAKPSAAPKRKTAGKKAPACAKPKPRAKPRPQAKPLPSGGGMHPAPAAPKPSAASKPSAAPKPPKAPPGPPAVPEVIPPVAVTGATYDGPVYSGPFGPRQAERLLWRAGFGPRPGDGERLAALGLHGAVDSLVRPSGDPVLTGPEPTYVSGGVVKPINPETTWGHDHLAWLDRMIRSSHQLSERMALIFHDWFATTDAAVGSQRLMRAQTDLFRRRALGSFEELVLEVTRDPAMLLFLNGTSNRKGAINENYAREVMELFALGADRGAYSESDVRELARALSGFRNDWSNELGNHNFRWDATRWDDKPKTVFGKTGNYGWEAAARLVVQHPRHPSFFVRKLWGYFVAGEPPAATAAALERLYVGTGLQIGPVVEAILRSPELYGARMVKPPVVHHAGMMRARGKHVASDHWVWLADGAGQKLHHPPDVAGWRDDAWLDTSTVRGRWEVVNRVLEGDTVPTSYPAETSAEAVDRALAFWGRPELADETVASLVAWSTTAAAALRWGDKWSQRQNTLRHLIAMSPDYLTS